MDVSVIVSTYNSPAWLAKSLWGFQEQTVRDFEIVVADDGSGDETREVIERFRAASGRPVQHVWHADDGFRKCRILNRGILAAQGDYLVFTDGDCIPRNDFLATHISMARPETFLSGGYVKLPLATSRKISRQDIQSGQAFDSNWLRANGLKPSPKHVKLKARGGPAQLLNALTTTRASWNGHNSSTWAAAARQVNGFDERLHYGGEDREFGERLINAGLRTRQIRFSAICVHLEHSRDYVRSERVDETRKVRRETQRSRSRRAHIGLEELQAEAEAAGGRKPATKVRARAAAKGSPSR
jgi:glycosyltransferase involved in cell wall biosynthesis